MRATRFTSVELLTVVAVVSVLAAIALPSMYEQQLKAKKVELHLNLDGIRVAEQAYEAEFDSYVPAVSFPSAFQPDATPGKTLRTWNVLPPFDDLGWAPDGQVRCSYILQIDVWPKAFLSQGLCDLDANGVPVLWSTTAISLPAPFSGQGCLPPSVSSCY